MDLLSLFSLKADYRHHMVPFGHFTSGRQNTVFPGSHICEFLVKPDHKVVVEILGNTPGVIPAISRNFLSLW